MDSKIFTKIMIFAILLISFLLISCGSDNVDLLPEVDDDVDLEINIWDASLFGDVREPFYFSLDMPHGELGMRYIKYLNDNFYTRSSFSYRELSTAVWLVEELLAMGYAWDNIQVQTFHQAAISLSPIPLVPHMLQFPDVRGYSQNVILTVPGQSEGIIIIGAHYDTFDTFAIFQEDRPKPGGSDNASGVALLLENARRMRYLENYHTLVYVFFGAEEIGLVGAYYFVESLTDEQRENILFMFNADILISGPYMIYAAGFDYEGTAEANDISRQADEIAQSMYALHGIELIPRPQGIFRGSDQLAFVEAGFTVVDTMGLDIDDAGRFGLRSEIHTPLDCIHLIRENWPGEAERKMHGFSLFLEKLILNMR